MSNLLAAMLNKLGMPTEKFGDGTGGPQKRGAYVALAIDVAGGAVPLVGASAGRALGGRQDRPAAAPIACRTVASNSDLENGLCTTRERSASDARSTSPRA